MELKSLSANALKTWLACEAMGAYTYVEKGLRGEGGQAANLGSAIHLALERFVGMIVANEDFIRTADLWEHLDGHFNDAILEVVNPVLLDVYLTQGRPLLQRWLARQDWEAWAGYKILSTEARQEFPVTTSSGQVIPFVYIIDLKREMPDGTVEVVDYKSGRYQLGHAQLKKDLQALSYATAIWVERPWQSRYWVTMDYLAGVETGVSFRASECEDFYKFIVKTADRIIAMKDPREQVNPSCRFCPRKHECKALLSFRHEPLPYLWAKDSLAARRVELGNIKTAIEASITEVDAAIKGVLEDDDMTSLTSPDGSLVELTSRTQRRVDVDALRAVLGDDELAGLATPGVTQVEAMAASETDPVRRRAIMRALKPGTTTPTLRVISAPTLDKSK